MPGRGGREDCCPGECFRNSRGTTVWECGEMAAGSQEAKGKDGARS